jgi:hypothetical protein
VVFEFFEAILSKLFYLAACFRNLVFMSLEEFENSPDANTKRYAMMKSIMDFGMGLIYIGVGIVIFFPGEFHLKSSFADSTLAKIFAVLVIVYGSWRIYRGIRKDYFKKK